MPKGVLPAIASLTPDQAAQVLPAIEELARQLRALAYPGTAKPKFVVYIMWSWADERIYVGHTQDMTSRYSRHLDKAYGLQRFGGYQDHSAQSEWLRDMRARGIEVEIAEVDRFPTRDQAREAEGRLIHELANLGFVLTNVHYNWTDEEQGR